MFAAFFVRLYLRFTFFRGAGGRVSCMATTQQNNRKTDRQSRAAVRRLLSALDRLIVAAKQAERARDELERSNTQTNKQCPK